MPLKTAEIKARVPADLRRRFEAAATAESRTISSLLVVVVAGWLKSRERSGTEQRAA